MNTKIIFTRNSPVRTVLVNETTGQELYKINTPYRFVGSVTRVFRCDPAASPNPIPQLHWDANEPYEGHDSEEWRLPAGVKSDRYGGEDGNESDSGVTSAVNAAPGGNSPLVGDEIARLYWKWFASTRIVFEGKIRRRAEFMPSKGKLGGSYVFNHNGVAYRWSLGAFRGPRLVIDDPDKTLIAQFHEASLFKKEKSYLEVTLAGMGMLDHIIVTFIPVEVRRRED